jgi:hypothetical protein
MRIHARISAGVIDPQASLNKQWIKDEFDDMNELLERSRNLSWGRGKYSKNGASERRAVERRLAYPKPKLEGRRRKGRAAAAAARRRQAASSSDDTAAGSGEEEEL